MTTIYHDTLDERAQTFRDVIRDYADLPRPHVTEIKGDCETGVRMQFLRLDEVITWCIRFGTPLQLMPTRMFVRASTQLLIDGVFVLAWTQLDTIEAWALLKRCGVDPTDREFDARFTREGVDIPASHAFAVSTLATAS